MIGLQNQLVRLPGQFGRLDPSSRLPFFDILILLHRV